MPVARRLPLVLSIAALAAVPAAAQAKPVHAGHGLPAKWQHRFGVKSAAADADRDGLSNFGEFRSHTNPKKTDTDHDGVTDAGEDFDRDGVGNGNEQAEATDPGKRDTDGDGRADGREDADGDGLNNLAEQRTANDPVKPDTDDDGIDDGDENAGRVVSWDGDTLTIRLAATGKTVTANVGDDTDLECGAGAALTAGDDQDTSSDDTPDDTSSDDTSSDDDLTSDYTSDLSAASVRAASSGDDEEIVDDGEDTGAEGSVDPCFDDVLRAGAWVHEAELDEDDSSLFSTVSLVESDA